MRLRLSKRARNDIKEIRAYLLPRSKVGAESVRASIVGTLDLLAQFPKSGRETDIPGIRVLPVVRYPYVIYYTILPRQIVIAHIRHATRDAAEADELE